MSVFALRVESRFPIEKTLIFRMRTRSMITGSLILKPVFSIHLTSQFCYVCILEWSKVKAECPLCKQSFKSIIHSVVSMDQYEQYYVPPPVPAPSDSPEDHNDFLRSLRLFDWDLGESWGGSE